MKRPKLITIICVTGYLSVLFSFPQVFSPAVKKLGVLMPALYGVLVAAHFISCVGLWYFKQWGAQLYLLAFFAKTLFFLLTAQTGVLFYLNATVSIVFMVILVKYFPKMNPNL
jgi:uncharacterized membrane protein (DUF2068 family)